ncbi:hypothetical protein BJ165DRAFT_698025 [Panaeolus papilionaceus]|nr:hypothetical protein BJ165DRAFT_698025 [Panaeolus papilionaceus]
MDPDRPQVLIRNADISIVNGTYIHTQTHTVSRVSNTRNVAGVNINSTRAPYDGRNTAATAAPYQSHDEAVGAAVQRIGPDNAQVYSRATFNGQCYTQSSAVLDPNEVFEMSDKTAFAIDLLFEDADWDGTRGHPQGFAAQAPNSGIGFMPQHPDLGPALDATFTPGETVTTTTVATNTNTISYNAASHTVRA